MITYDWTLALEVYRLEGYIIYKMNCVIEEKRRINSVTAIGTNRLARRTRSAGRATNAYVESRGR